MISLDKAAQHLRGAWRLVARDAAWREEMDLSLDGVFNSLWAFLLAVPFALLSILAENRLALSMDDYSTTIFAKAPLSAIAVASLLISAIIWAGTLYILAYAAKRAGASRSVAGLIVSYNWTQLLVYIASAAPALAILLGGAMGIAGFLYLLLFGFSLYIFWVVLRENLPLGTSGIVALIAGLTILSLAIYSLMLNALIALFGSVT